MSKGGRREGAGRPKGSANKKSLAVEQLLASMGVNPIVGMAHIASNNKEALGITDDVPITIRAQMYKELATYTAYRLKAVEVTVDQTMPTHEERLSRLK